MLEKLPRFPLTDAHTLKHGGRSQQLLLQREDPNALLELHRIYWEEFAPQTPFLQELLEEAVNAHWLLKRNQYNLQIVQDDLSEDPRQWTPEDHHQLALFTRYQTTAERTYHRALARLRCYHRDHLQKTERLNSQSRKESGNSETTKPAKSKNEPAKAPKILEQWIEVRRVGNTEVTEFYPSNEELEQIIAEMNPKPDFIYRRIFFPDGVPARYGWTRPRTGQAELGGLAVQRLPLDVWLSLREKERESGHAESAGQPSLPDWRDRDPA